MFVDDQAKAHDFYSEKLGFVVKNDIPLGDTRWLNVVSPDQPEGTDLLLEPSDHPAVPQYKAAIVADGIPAASSQVDNLDAEHKCQGSLGVEFMQYQKSKQPYRFRSQPSFELGH